MKRFFALWIISIVLASIFGVVFGVGEYLLSDIHAGQRGECINSVIRSCLYLDDFFITYPVIASLNMIWIYPVFRVIGGSFKTIFFNKELHPV